MDKIEYPKQEKIKQLFYYKDGNLYWKKRPRNNVDITKFAGWISDKQRKCVMIKHKQYYTARIIWIYFYGSIDVILDIDHINHNTLDNRIENLRLVTAKENSKNKSKYKNNTSGYTGICLHPINKNWLAYIRFNNKRVHLGSFSNIEDAIKIRKQAEINYKYHHNHGKEI